MRGLLSSVPPPQTSGKVNINFLNKISFIKNKKQKVFVTNSDIWVSYHHENRRQVHWAVSLSSVMVIVLCGCKLHLSYYSTQEFKSKWENECKAE